MAFRKLDLVSVTKVFGNGASAVVAVDDVSLTIGPGEFVVVVGGNGSGKSTLLNVIAGSVQPTRGQVVFSGNGSGPIDWTGWPAWKRAGWVARIHQNAALSTVAELTVGENLRLALLQHRRASPFTRGFRSGERMRHRDGLSAIGLQKHLDTYVEDLSQGQRQLLAVYAALQREPRVLLLDEHTASLDRRNAAECLRVTEQLCREAGVAVVMVTHNFSDALAYGDRLVALVDGKVAAAVSGDDKRNLTIATLHELCGF
jgi:putative ABC transport system ATP-binding protein